MSDFQLEPLEGQIRETRRGRWRRHVYPDGSSFVEYRSHETFLGWPLIHYTRGIDPAIGRRRVARGVLAVGRIAVGGLALGQAAFGLLALGQVAVGLFAALGQLTAGGATLGQVALGLTFGAGQLATGETAIGQLAAGRWVLAQFGIGEHLWTPQRADPEAVEHFTTLWHTVREWLPAAWQ